MSSISILVVDNHKDWRKFVRLLLLIRPEWQIIGEASDGPEAVQKAGELRPDLIVLDIGLPTLNGIEAARRIQQISPSSKIVFLSIEDSLDAVHVALNTGARGYVYKADAQSDLLSAIDAVLAGKQFVSRGLKGHKLLDAALPMVPEELNQKEFFYAFGKRVRELRRQHGYSQEDMISFGFSARHWQQIEAGRSITVVTLLRICEVFKTSAERLVRGLDRGIYGDFRHEVLFYSDDMILLERLTRFVAATLKGGNAAIVLATKSHRDSLLQRLKTECVDIDGAFQQGTLISLDARKTLSTIMVNGLPDPVQFVTAIGGLIEAASKATKAAQPKVAVFGEAVALLQAEGKADAAIRFEQLGNDLAKTHEANILCAYPLSGFHGQEDHHVLHSICAEHSAVSSW